MLDNHYTNKQLVALYDLDSGWSVDRDFYLGQADKPSMHILDVGCGTGLLCDHYARNGHHVTGIDPAELMLAEAAGKPNGQNIEWICTTAQDFKSDTRYDLIIMTGHAFQVLINKADILACLKMMRTHLKPSGKIVFESRNPAIDWSQNWDYDMSLTLPNQDIVHETRHFISMEDGLMTFELRYRFPQDDLVSTSQLRFLDHQDIKDLLQQAQLKISETYGDWDKSPFNPSHSEEMIFVAMAD